MDLKESLSLKTDLGTGKHGDKLGGYWSCLVYNSFHQKAILVVFIEIRCL